MVVGESIAIVIRPKERRRGRYIVLDEGFLALIAAGKVSR